LEEIILKRTKKGLHGSTNKDIEKDLREEYGQEE